MEDFKAWHYAVDTLPHLLPNDRDSLVLHIPIGIWSQWQRRFNIIAEVEIEDKPSFRIGFDRANENGFVRGIPRGITKNSTFLEWYFDYFGDVNDENKKDRLSALNCELRWYMEMEDQPIENQYYEAVVKNIPLGKKVTYSIKILALTGSVKLLPSTSDHKYTIHATIPNFEYQHIFAVHYDKNPTSINKTFALYYKEDDTHHHIRVDFIDFAEANSSGLDFRLKINDRDYTLSHVPFRPDDNLLNPDQLPSLLLINPFADYITVSIPKAELPEVTTVQWRGKDYNVRDRDNVGQARIMFIHFCNQALNDLFEVPNKNYEPPRSFIQLTMRDDLAVYSSRPNSEENFNTSGGIESDGYLYTLDSHRKHQIPYLWAFNGGVLILIAHDCPGQDGLEQIKKDIKNKLIDPASAGFGAHRLPYYQEETNYYSIRYGIDIIEKLLEHCNLVYYPDQRLYKKIPNVTEALKRTGVQYIVVDGSTGFYPYESTVKLNENGKGIHPDDQYLWQDESSGLYILYITDELREKIVASSEEEMKRGKLARDLRHKFFYFASQPNVRRNHLMIYSDDAEKASGTGWFDGGYSGRQIPFKGNYDAALEWIAAHPWIKAVTSEHLDPDCDCVGTIDMETATCPSVDPGGVLTTDYYGKQLHFDTWYDNWKDFRSDWLDQTMEEISQSIEFAIIDWPSQYRNNLYKLGQMTFSMYIHESQWNKQTLETDPNTRNDVREPEDFVIAASLQTRNAQVYLNAAVWAEWASHSSDTSTYLNNGPVIDMLRDICYEGESWRDERYQNKPILANPLHWDRDLLSNVVLYNKDVLIVMDQNGGRITHLFALYNGEPYCISGTFKCYQYITSEKTAFRELTCDGEVLQNTVYTPNHAYIACDVQQSCGIIGTKYNPKTGVERDLDCYYPDNFNTYRFSLVNENTVEWFYEKATEEVPERLDLTKFRSLLAKDRKEKMSGQRGVVLHSFPPFQKQISLHERTITIRYSNAQKNHVVANEFCMDLYESVMLGKRNSLPEIKEGEELTEIEISNGASVFAHLKLGDNCEFTNETKETLGEINNENKENEQNKVKISSRLHRVMTDCFELQSKDVGEFSYQIQV
jgi:hypothetical protein